MFRYNFVSVEETADGHIAAAFADPSQLMLIDCQRRRRTEPLWPVQAGASGPPREPPVDGDAVSTLQQFLNCLVLVTTLHV
jgi:hypothetical protein